MGEPRSAIVVGAGIVGLSTAWFLQERDIAVTVIDRVGVAAGAIFQARVGEIRRPGLAPIGSTVDTDHLWTELLENIHRPLRRDFGHGINREPSPESYRDFIAGMHAFGLLSSPRVAAITGTRHTRAFVESASALKNAAAICERPALCTHAKITVFT